MSVPTADQPAAPTFHQPTAPPARRRRAVGFAIASALTGALALSFLGAGGALLYAETEKDDDGYYNTSTEHLHTGSYAIASGPLDLDLDGIESLVEDTDLGRVRIHPESNGGEPVFVGIARSDHVNRYLRGTAHTTVTDIDGGAFGLSLDPTYRDSAGKERPATPAGRDLWVASASGTGEQTLEWKARDGDWSVVVMNADGSRGVDTSVSAGAKLPFVGPVGWTALGVGVVAAAIAAGLLLLGFRGPRRDQYAPAPPAA